MTLNIPNFTGIELSKNHQDYDQLTDYINEHTTVGELNFFDFEYVFIVYFSVLLIILVAFLFHQFLVFYKEHQIFWSNLLNINFSKIRYCNFLFKLKSND